MPLADLDLEFEDEEGTKKSDAVSVDVDLQFGTDTNIAIQRPSSAEAPQPVAKQQPAAPAAQTAPRPAAVAKSPAPESNVRPIAPKAQASPVKATSAPISTPAVGSAALKIESSLSESSAPDLLTQLQARLEQIEKEAQIKIAVAEFKTDILSDLLSDIKLLEHQMSGILGRIHTKHPDLKQEVLILKKLLSDFSNKKRK